MIFTKRIPIIEIYTQIGLVKLTLMFLSINIFPLHYQYVVISLHKSILSKLFIHLDFLQVANTLLYSVAQVNSDVILFVT